jgi:hypothetical protein
MVVDTLSKPTARKAEFLSGRRKDQKAKAARRKTTGSHNWADRAGKPEIPTRDPSADVILVHHPKNEVKITHQGKS